ncbi:MAG: glycosyltransferase family 2 protein [Bacteroidetes bacterium]|nr:glycosyltransferase family 2 protein [Bacteroidota bacterium]
MSTLFSIIVANYNNGRFLDDLVKSVLSQTYTNWELIIADDASQDESEQVVSKYLSDTRIKFIKHTINKGAGGAFKTAADNSKGEIIGMLGADDALDPDTIRIMVEAHAANPGAVLVTTRAYDCDLNLKPYGICEISDKQPEGVPLIKDVRISNFVTFKRKNYLQTEGFSDNIKRAVDIDIYLQLEETGGSLFFVDKPLYLYRRHLQGISQGGENGVKAATFSLRAKMNAYQRRLKTGFTPNLTKQEYEEIAKTYYQRHAIQSRQQGAYKEAINHLLQLLKVSPRNIVSRTFWSGMAANLYRIVKG